MKRTRPVAVRSTLFGVYVNDKLQSTVRDTTTVAQFVEDQRRPHYERFLLAYDPCLAHEPVKGQRRFLRDPETWRIYAIREISFQTVSGDVAMRDVVRPTDSTVQVVERFARPTGLAAYTTAFSFRTCSKSGNPDVYIAEPSVAAARHGIAAELNVPVDQVHVIVDGAVLDPARSTFKVAKRHNGGRTSLVVAVVADRVTLLPPDRPHYCTILPSVIACPIDTSVPAVRVVVELGDEARETLSLWCHPDVTAGDIEARVNMELEPGYFAEQPRHVLEEAQRDASDQLSYAARQRLLAALNAQ